MKIEIGKKYKSNVCHRAGPRQADNSQELFYEEWEIMFKLPDGKFLGRLIRGDDTTKSWREFDSQGNGSTTGTGKPRSLVPNTTTVTKYVVVWQHSGTTYFSSLHPTREAAVEWSEKYSHYPNANAIGTLTYEVED